MRRYNARRGRPPEPAMDTFRAKSLCMRVTEPHRAEGYVQSPCRQDASLAFTEAVKNLQRELVLALGECTSLGGRVGSFPEQRFEIATAAHDAKDHHVVAHRAVQDDVLADRKGADTCSKLVSLTADERISGEEKEPGSQCFDETIRDVDATLSRNVVPGLEEIGFGFRGEAMRH